MTRLFSTFQKVSRCRLAKLWRLYSGTLRKLYRLTSTITRIYYADLIRTAWAALKEKRRGKLCHVRGAVSPGQRTCWHVISSTGCHPKCRIRTTPSPTVFARHGSKFKRLLCFLNWRNSWKDANLLTTRTLSALQMAGWKTKINNLLQWNPSFGETLDQVHFSWRRPCWKSDKIWCAYLMANCQATNYLNGPCILSTDFSHTMEH